MTLPEHAAEWRALADEAERSVKEGWACCEGAALAKAELYRRTAEAIELEARTGVPHCACCLKPMAKRSS